MKERKEKTRSEVLRAILIPSESAKKSGCREGVPNRFSDLRNPISTRWPSGTIQRARRPHPPILDDLSSDALRSVRVQLTRTSRLFVFCGQIDQGGARNLEDGHVTCENDKVVTDPWSRFCTFPSLSFTDMMLLRLCGAHAPVLVQA